MGRKAGNACECQDGGIQGREQRHYPGAQGYLGMNLEGRHGPHKNSNIRDGAEGQFSWTVLALYPTLEHSFCNSG